MPQNNPLVITKIEQRRDSALSERMATAATELIAWYRELPLRRVRKLVKLPQVWYDQRDYLPIAEIIDLYEAFLQMTSGQEEKAVYTLDLIEVGIPALYVVEMYEYVEYQSNLTIGEARWYHLFTSSLEYRERTGRDPRQDIGKSLMTYPGKPTVFSINGFAMRASEEMQNASYYRKTWYDQSTPSIKKIIRQEVYKRIANRLERYGDCSSSGS